MGGAVQQRRPGRSNIHSPPITVRSQANDAYVWTNHVNLTRPYTANGLNQYTVSGDRSPTYDANGSLAYDGAIAFTYDAENRLVAASCSRTSNLSYDPIGRLAQTSGGPSGTTQYLYDGDQLVAEYDGAGTLLRRYVHGPGVDDPLIWYEGAGLGDRRQLFTNHQGSITAVTDASGAKLSINAYGPFGEPTQWHRGRFGYTGQIWLTDLALWDYKARVYSPDFGRFLQTDPVGYEDQMNLYAYVGNDPMNSTDPTGENRYKLELDISGTLGLGGDTSISLEVDTETLEIGGSVEVGISVGLGTSISGSFERSASSEQSNQGAIGGEVKAEAEIGVRLGEDRSLAAGAEASRDTK